MLTKGVAGDAAGGIRYRTVTWLAGLSVSGIRAAGVSMDARSEEADLSWVDFEGVAVGGAAGTGCAGAVEVFAGEGLGVADGLSSIGARSGCLLATRSEGGFASAPSALGNAKPGSNAVRPQQRIR